MYYVFIYADFHHFSPLYRLRISWCLLVLLQ